ncbi:MAG TPA: hypothetical protein VJB14_12635 [Planctomycetota bacterium]|nr:hypothetical protein [Planctomycetota bacterium]
MIRLLNAHFIPVYTSMEDYVGKNASVPEDERKAYQKIYHAAIAKKLSTGTVHLYFLTPEGDPIDSIHVAHAKAEKVIATAKAVVEKLGTPEGKGLIEPRPQAAGPKAPEGSLVLHLVARTVPGKAGGFWGELPGEDFIVYSKEEQAKFLPSGDSKGWDVDREVALKLLNYFYPSTENNSIATNEVEAMSMKATLVAAGKVRLDATLRMKHPFYHKKDNATVDAVAVGVVDFEGTRITKFRMATEKATYNGGTFGVAVQEVR